MDELKKYQQLINEWIDDEKKVTCGKEAARKYKESSMKRFQYLLGMCKALNPEKSIDVLDVGRSYLSFMLSEYYNNLTTLGFELDDDGDQELDKKNIDHLVFDLNRSQDTNLWPRDKKYDLIICSQVIEHLHVAPEFSLLFLKYLLKPEGLLICSTPNAAAIHKRLKMVFGKNPFEKIRFYGKNPGHFREYTHKELKDMGKKCGLDFVSHKYLNSFTHKGVSFAHKLLEIIYIVITGFIRPWKNLHIIVFKNPSS